MKRKKYMGLFAASMLITALLSGCGDNGAAGGQDSGNDSAVADRQEASGEATGNQESGTADENEKYTITWVGWTGPTDNDGVIVKEIEKKFNVDLDIWDVTEGSTLSVRLASGEVPDFFPVPAGDYRKYAEDGLLAEIPDEVLAEHAPNLYQAYQEEVSPEDMAVKDIDGTSYGLVIPNPESGSFRHLIVYRGDWMEKVGVEKTPETLDEFVDLMYKFAKEDPDGNGQDDTYGLSSSMIEVVYGAYGYLPNFWAENDGELVYGGIQPEMKEALKVLRQLYEDGILDPEYVLGENRGGEWSVSTQFVTGLIGTTSYPEYLYWKPAEKEGEREGSNITEMKSLNPDAVDKLVYGNPVTGPEGKKGVELRSALQGSLNCFGAQVMDEPGKMERILEILDYSCATYEGYMLTRYGIEGEHYEMDEDGYPVALGNYSLWNEIVRIGAGATINDAIWLPSIIEKVNKEYAWGASMPELKEDGIKDAVYIPAPSASQYKAELDKIREEAYADIITGVQPIDYFDEFVEKWKSSGGDILTEEYNSIGK